MQIAKKFEFLLDAYRHPNGQPWKGQEIDKATGGVVTRSYVTNLRKGRIENPGYEKLAALAKVMGFPPELWFKKASNLDGTLQTKVIGSHRSLSARVNHLLNVLRNDTTGKAYTDAEIARLSFGALTEEEVEAIRSGSDSDPSMMKVSALADVLGVDASYFFDQGEKWSLLDQEALHVFRDETVNVIARKSLYLREREKQTILSILKQFEDLREIDRNEV